MAGNCERVHHDDGNDVEDSGSGREEDCLIKQRKSSQHAIRRVSTNCTHLTVACPTCKGKGKLSQGIGILDVLHPHLIGMKLVKNDR